MRRVELSAVPWICAKCRVELSALGKMYIVCALLANTQICFYKSMTSTFFDFYPLLIEHFI